jgi:membrane-anchored glycerophosphoryl diester phosphodiesterase (GDPDase)
LDTSSQSSWKIKESTCKITLVMSLLLCLLVIHLLLGLLQLRVLWVVAVMEEVEAEVLARVFLMVLLLCSRCVTTSPQMFMSWLTASGRQMTISVVSKSPLV